MKMQFGKYIDKPVELLVLKEPQYIHWLLQQNASGSMLTAQNEAKRLIKIFDQKPFHADCYGNECSAKATCLSLYSTNISPFWWCANCDPYQAGAMDGKLNIFCTYTAALSYVEMYRRGLKADYKKLITAIAQAKGLPSRVGESQALAFLEAA